MITVRQLMSTDLKTCSPEDSLHTAAQLLWNHDVGAVAVVNAGRVVGMITDRDVCMAAFHQGRPLHEIQVSSTMAKQLRTITPDDQLEDAMRLMSEHQLRRLPVVDTQGRLKGMLSLADLARESIKPKAKAQPKTVLETFAAVCQPRVMTTSATRAGSLVATS